MALLDLNQLKLKYSLDIKKIAHIGAHKGQEVEDYLSCFPDVQIHLFEPQKKIFSYLEKSFGNIENISLHNFALGSTKHHPKTAKTKSENGNPKIRILK